MQQAGWAFLNISQKIGLDPTLYHQPVRMDNYGQHGSDNMVNKIRTLL